MIWYDTINLTGLKIIRITNKNVVFWKQISIWYFKKYIEIITYWIDLDQPELTYYICDPG
jgi:hypothetical protein